MTVCLRNAVKQRAEGCARYHATTAVEMVLSRTNQGRFCSQILANTSLALLLKRKTLRVALLCGYLSAMYERTRNFSPRVTRQNLT